MAARLDWDRWTWPLAVACMAAPIGVIAGLDPRLALVAAIGLGFMLVVFANLTTGVVLFTLLTFFELLPGGEGVALSFTKIAGLLLAISWLARMATRADAAGDALREHPMITGVLVVFLAWAGLSFAWAEQPSAAFEAFYRLALNAVLFLIVYAAVRTPRDAIAVLTAFVIGATAAVLYGITIAGVDPTPYGEAARISSGDENANELASTLVASMALALGLAFAMRGSPAFRVAMLAMAAVAFFGIVLTVSRSGLVSLGVAALAAIVFSGRWRAAAVALSTTVAVLAVGYFAFFAPDVARERITEANGGTGRTDIWRVAWRMVEDQPVQGVGAGNFRTSSIHYLLAPGALQRSDFIVDTQKVAHNVYLETLAELGVIGLAFLVLLIVMVLAQCIRGIRQFERNGDLRMEIIARANLIALFGLLASLFFSSDQYKKQLWLLLAMAPALLAIARSEGSAGEERDTRA